MRTCQGFRMAVVQIIRIFFFRFAVCAHRERSQGRVPADERAAQSVRILRTAFRTAEKRITVTPGRRIQRFPDTVRAGGAVRPDFRDFLHLVQQTEKRLAFVVRHIGFAFDDADGVEPECTRHCRRQTADKAADLFIGSFQTQKNALVRIGGPAGQPGFRDNFPEERPDASRLNSSPQFECDTVLHNSPRMFFRYAARASGKGRRVRSSMPKQNAMAVP